jgi:rare lipoprotein A
MGEVLVAQTPASALAVATAPRAAPRPATRLAAAGPPSLRAAEIIGNLPPATPAATGAPPFQSAQSPPPAVAAPARRYWPSLIASAQAETLRPSTIPTAAKGSGRIFVQAGTFAVPENAQRVRARIAALGSTEVVAMSRSGGALYRVRLGPLASEAEAARMLRRVVDSGYPGARMVGE